MAWCVICLKADAKGEEPKPHDCGLQRKHTYLSKEEWAMQTDIKVMAAAIKADCERTDPDDFIEQRKLVTRIYGMVCKVVR